MSLRAVFKQAYDDAEARFSKFNDSPFVKKLMEPPHKFHAHDKKTVHRDGRYATFLIYVFFSTTTIYTCLRYAIPFYWGYLGELPESLLKFGAIWVFIQASMNWLCVQLFRSHYNKSNDRPVMEKQNEDDEITYTHAAQSWKPLSWTFCDVCQTRCPPRGHHCRICGKCILKHDHHCVLVGTCIGYNNQRYFIVLTFYLTLASAFGTFLDYQYMKEHFWPTCDYIDLFLPYTVYRFVTFDLEHQYMLMIIHLYFLWAAGMLSSGFGMFQLLFTLLGETKHETFTNMTIKVTSTVSENFNSVFGAYWLVNFFFPAVNIFPQPPDGTRWEKVYIPAEATYQNLHA